MKIAYVMSRFPKHTETFILYEMLAIEEQGYLPEAMLNYLVRLGWSHGDQEIFSVDEMIRLFDIKDVNQSASSFNPEKLLWINQQHIISTPAEKLGAALMPFLVRAGLDPADGPDPVHVAEGFHERAETLLHMAASARYCYEDFEVIRKGHTWGSNRLCGGGCQYRPGRGRYRHGGNRRIHRREHGATSGRL